MSARRTPAPVLLVARDVALRKELAESLADTRPVIAAGPLSYWR